MQRTGVHYELAKLILSWYYRDRLFLIAVILHPPKLFELPRGFKSRFESGPFDLDVYNDAEAFVQFSSRFLHALAREKIKMSNGQMVVVSLLSLLVTSFTAFADVPTTLPDGASAQPTTSAASELKLSTNGEVAAADSETVSSKLERGLKLRRSGNFKEAEQLFKDAIRLSASDKVQEAKAHEALAGLYLSTGRLEESQSLYGKAIQTLEACDKPLQLAIAYDNMSNVCLARHKLDDAEGYNKKALSILEKPNVASKIDLAKSINQMALISVANNKSAEAEAAFKRCINIFPQPKGVDEQVFVATSLDNLGGLYLKGNLFSQAETSRKKALAMFETALGPKSTETAKCLQNLAAVYGHQKKFEEALPYLKRAEAIDESVLGLRNPTTLAALKSYIVLLKLTHKDKELQELVIRVNGLGASTLTLPARAESSAL